MNGGCFGWGCVYPESFVDALIGTIECVETGTALASAALASKFEKQ